MAGGKSSDASDEDVLDGTIDEMMSMCGNEGQMSIIERNMGAFFDWGLAALEEEGAFGTFEDMMEALDLSLGDHSYQATEEIWEQGYYQLTGQSAYHDGYDEQGEGTGDHVVGF